MLRGSDKTTSTTSTTATSSTSTQNLPVLCWDFDGCWTGPHMHNALLMHFDECIKPTAEYQEFRSTLQESECPMAEVLEKFSQNFLDYYKSHLLKKENIRNLEMLAQTLIVAMQKGHPQAVVSFTWFPQVIKPTARFILENYLKSKNDGEISIDNQTVIDQFINILFVVGGFPDQGGVKVGGGQQSHYLAKLFHLQIVQNHFNVEDRSSLCLIDDSHRNFSTAQRQGFQCIWANPTDRDHYLTLVNRMITPITASVLHQAFRSLTLNGDESSEDDSEPSLEGSSENTSHGLAFRQRQSLALSQSDSSSSEDFSEEAAPAPVTFQIDRDRALSQAVQSPLSRSGDSILCCRRKAAKQELGRSSLVRSQ